MNAEEIKQCADQVLADHPDTDSVLVVSDGTCFMPDALNLARDYARRNGQELQEVKRGEAVSDDQVPPTHDVEEMTVAEIKDWAQTQDEVDELKFALGFAPSKGGVEAIQNRIDELKSDGE